MNDNTGRRSAGVLHGAGSRANPAGRSGDAVPGDSGRRIPRRPGPQRYVVPAVALEKLAAEAAETGGRVDVARMAAQRRTARDIARLTGGAPW